MIDQLGKTQSSVQLEISGFLLLQAVVAAPDSFQLNLGVNASYFRKYCAVVPVVMNALICFAEEEIYLKATDQSWEVTDRAVVWRLVALQSSILYRGRIVLLVGIGLIDVHRRKQRPVQVAEAQSGA